jgi:putative ABC transport system ATP-binding protein
MSAAMAHDEFAVRCRGVSKAYGSGGARVPALRGVDLDVRRGELLMVAGPSGCGKTTFLSVLSGLLDQDEGQCEVLGREPARMDADQRDRFRGESIGFVFQAFNLLPALSAVDNVSVPLMINGLPRPQAVERSRDLLEQVGLSSRGDRRPGQLSGGEQQRIAIARALIHNPRLIVCDEPTSNLDHHTGQEMMSLLRGLAAQAGNTLIIVTHDDRILKFADRIAHMDDGRIVGIDDRENRVPDP